MYYSFGAIFTGATKTNIVVTIRGRIVQIQGKNTSIRTIVPIATAEKGALWVITQKIF